MYRNTHVQREGGLCLCARDNLFLFEYIRKLLNQFSNNLCRKESYEIRIDFAGDNVKT